MSAENEQATSAPYAQDNLATHDFALVWAREFGTETTTNVGDAVQAGAIDEAEASINARLGMLQVSTLGNSPESAITRGRNFVTPEWGTYPLSPLFGFDIRTIMIYAHTFMSQTEESAPNDTEYVDLLLGGIDFVGEVAAEPFSTCSIRFPSTAGLTIAQPDANVEDWADGVSPEGPAVGVAWGNGLYWRILAATDGLKETDLIVDVSRDGIGWTQLGQFVLAEPLRRIGLGCRGLCTGLLDWCRIYVSPFDDFDSYFLPRPPKTGGRLYIP